MTTDAAPIKPRAAKEAPTRGREETSKRGGGHDLAVPQLSHIHQLTERAVEGARAGKRLRTVQELAARTGFTIDLTPRAAEDPRTLTVPSDVPVPEELLTLAAQLARYLRCRATDGLCTPVTLHLRPKPTQEPN